MTKCPACGGWMFRACEHCRRYQAVAVLVETPALAAVALKDAALWTAGFRRSEGPVRFGPVPATVQALGPDGLAILDAVATLLMSYRRELNTQRKQHNDDLRDAQRDAAAAYREGRDDGHQFVRENW